MKSDLKMRQGCLIAAAVLTNFTIVTVVPVLMARAMAWITAEPIKIALSDG